MGLEGVRARLSRLRGGVTVESLLRVRVGARARARVGVGVGGSHGIEAGPVQLHRQVRIPRRIHPWLR